MSNQLPNQPSEEEMLRAFEEEFIPLLEEDAKKAEEEKKLEYYKKRKERRRAQRKVEKSTEESEAMKELREIDRKYAIEQKKKKKAKREEEKRYKGGPVPSRLVEQISIDDDEEEKEDDKEIEIVKEEEYIPVLVKDIDRPLFEPDEPKKSKKKPKKKSKKVSKKVPKRSPKKKPKLKPEPESIEEGDGWKMIRKKRRKRKPKKKVDVSPSISPEDKQYTPSETRRSSRSSENEEDSDEELGISSSDEDEVDTRVWVKAPIRPTQWKPAPQPRRKTRWGAPKPIHQFDQAKLGNVLEKLETKIGYRKKVEGKSLSELVKTKEKTKEKTKKKNKKPTKLSYGEFMEQIQEEQIEEKKRSGKYIEDCPNLFVIGHSEKDVAPGIGKKEQFDPLDNFSRLQKVQYWRRKLSADWKSHFMLEGKKWLTVQHYIESKKFLAYPEYASQFSVTSESELSRNVVMAISAGSKSGMYKNEYVRPPGVQPTNIYKDPRFYIWLTLATYAKFSQNTYLRDVLYYTKNACLYLNRPFKRATWLESVRNCLQMIDAIMDKDKDDSDVKNENDIYPRLEPEMIPQLKV